MINLLKINPLLLLFAVAAVGFLVGRVRVRGISLGVAAVLFTGLGFGALDPELRIPETLQIFGLVLFIYTIGLANGPTFFSSFGRQGLRQNALLLAALAVAATVTVGLAVVFGFGSGFAAGAFAGSLTNTPALANVVQYLQSHPETLARGMSLSDPVVAYSLAYPAGVLGPMLAIVLAYRVVRTRAATPGGPQPDPGESGENLENITVLVERAVGDGLTVSDLLARHLWDVMFVRICHTSSRGGASEVHLCGPGTTVRQGDLVSVLGHPQHLRAVAETLGHATDRHLEFDRSTLDFRRMFVSDPGIAGRRLAELNIGERFGALVTRVKRGDKEFLPDEDTVLELGDRVRVVAERSRMQEIGRFFGDSYKSLSEIDFMPLGLGVAIGFLLGVVPIPLPSGAEFRLGFAVGPLLAGLFFGWLERSRRIVWQLPYSANLTIRQLGLVLFLAGVGVNAGHAFLNAVQTVEGLRIFAAGTGITAVTALLTLWAGTRILKIPLDTLTGTLAGVCTQPAVLAFACDKSGKDSPALGYSLVFPLATILKVILAQWILLV